MIYHFRCLICNEEFDVVQSMNTEHKAYHCGIEAQRVWGCYTEKDKRYYFATDMFDGKSVEIRSKGQYKKLLKQHGMADASVKECRQEADFRKRLNNEDNIIQRKELARDFCLRKKIKLNQNVKG